MLISLILFLGIMLFLSIHKNLVANSKSPIWAFIWAILLVGITVYAFWLVADSCHHGNCRHGWYSKKNTGTKLLALSLIFGFLGAILLH